MNTRYADELASYVLSSLNIKTASVKTAGSGLDAYKVDLDKCVDENGLKLTWNKHLDALNQEESTGEALKLQAEKARQLGLPGYATPLADDKEVVARQFAVSQLVKIADVLDSRGFKSVANVIDETIAKLSK
jgi:hypothetical protein